jgi:hypothetical protein
VGKIGIFLLIRENPVIRVTPSLIPKNAGAFVSVPKG